MTVDTSKFENFLQFVVEGILDEPKSAEMTAIVDDRGILLTLTIPSSEMGKFIGKGGKTVQSTRTLLKAMGAKEDKSVNLKVIEKE